jgi:uncharacterized damage-inducible protein DinB
VIQVSAALDHCAIILENSASHAEISSISRRDWKPHEKSMSLSGLAGHLAETPSWLESMMQDVFDFAADMGDYKPFVPNDQGDLLVVLDENLANALSLLEGKDDDFMVGLWRGMMGEKELMAGPRCALARSILVQHAAHHRGQLTVYLRLLDVPVPPTYGPTADFPDWG